MISIGGTSSNKQINFSENRKKRKKVSGMAPVRFEGI